MRKRSDKEENMKQYRLITSRIRKLNEYIKNCDKDQNLIQINNSDFALGQENPYAAQNNIFYKADIEELSAAYETIIHSGVHFNVWNVNFCMDKEENILDHKFIECISNEYFKESLRKCFYLEYCKELSSKHTDQEGRIRLNIDNIISEAIYDTYMMIMKEREIEHIEENLNENYSLETLISTKNRPPFYLKESDVKNEEDFVKYITNEQGIYNNEECMKEIGYSSPEEFKICAKKIFTKIGIRNEILSIDNKQNDINKQFSKFLINKLHQLDYNKVNREYDKLNYDYGQKLHAFNIEHYLQNTFAYKVKSAFGIGKREKPIEPEQPKFIYNQDEIEKLEKQAKTETNASKKYLLECLTKCIGCVTNQSSSESKNAINSLYKLHQLDPKSEAFIIAKTCKKDSDEQKYWLKEAKTQLEEQMTSKESIDRCIAKERLETLRDEFGIKSELIPEKQAQQTNRQSMRMAM